MRKFSLVKQVLRHPYTWPGGYPLFFIMADGCTLSAKSARENYREICRAHIGGGHDTHWTIAAWEVNYEDEDLYCEHSNEPIECAYHSD